MKKYPELKNLIKIVKVLDELKIPYYITGGFAVSVYGRPRFTADVDVVIKMINIQVTDFAKKIQKIFPKGYVDESQINNALIQLGEFNIIDPESGLKVDFFITENTEFDKECFHRVVKHNLEYQVMFISAEGLIISKLLWYKESQSTRQLEDIKSVLDIQKKLDITYIKKWVKKLNLERQWGKLT